MDLAQSIEPNSQQVNAEDLLAGDRTVTITGVEAGNAEQPVFVHLAEFPGRTYRPSKSMRRLIVSAWGPDSSAYTGRQMTIFRNPDIRFGKDLVGGIQISHMSHLEKPLTVALAVSRGKRHQFTVQPLATPEKPKDTSGRDWLKELADTNSDLDAIFKLGTEARAAGAPDTIINVILTEYKQVEAGG
jgi:hypothetical protein